MSTDGQQPPGINWKDSIAVNIQFFREQGKLLDDIYNPGQIASGALMTVMIMNHNMLMSHVAAMHQRLANIEQMLGTPPSSEPDIPHRG